MLFLPRQPKTYPQNPGVYKMLNAQSDILYIGKAKNLQNRLKSYFNSSVRSRRIERMVADIVSIDITTTANENEALILEQQLINQIKPRYNIIFRDDKSYPFIALSKHEYPKIYVAREKRFNLKNQNLYGPYSNRDDAYRNLEFVQKTFQLRTCSDNDFATRSRACMLHSIGKCSAPCMRRGQPEFMEHYRKDVENAQSALRGHVRPLIQELEAEMVVNSQNLRFEEASRNRDAIASLENLTKTQKVYSLKQENVLVFNLLRQLAPAQSYVGFVNITGGLPRKIIHELIRPENLEFSDAEILETYVETQMPYFENYKIITPIALDNLFYPHKHDYLNKQEKEWLDMCARDLSLAAVEENRKHTEFGHKQQLLKEVFEHNVYGVECIDISHFSGEATYGAKIRWSISSTLDKVGLDTPWYRLSKFTSTKVNDVYYMGKTVEKIYHSNEDIPDILIIDGDKPQMESAFEALKAKHITKPFVLMCSAKGVSRKKGEEHFYVHPSSQNLVRPDFIQQGELVLPKTHPLRLHFQFLQDSAHNFSNAARKKAMSNSRFAVEKKSRLQKKAQANQVLELPKTEKTPKKKKMST